MLQVREVACKTVLRDLCLNCGSHAPKYSLNPYKGCIHGCIYCYAQSVTHEERLWGSFVDVKVNAPALLAREVVKKRRGRVFFSSSVDPYQPVEARCKITRRCLEILLEHGFHVTILTRSPLVLRDAELIARFPKKDVGFSITSLEESKLLEPRVPSVKRRLEALKKLSGMGIPTWVSIAPIIPDFTDRSLEALIERIADAGVKTVSTGPLRLKSYPTSLEHVRTRSTIDCFRSREYFQMVVERIKDLCEKYGIASTDRYLCRGCPFMEGSRPPSLKQTSLLFYPLCYETPSSYLKKRYPTSISPRDLTYWLR